MPSQDTMDAVLDLLRNHGYLPSEVIEKLLDAHSESDVKEAIAQLLHDQEVELAPDRRLHVLTAVV